MGVATMVGRQAYLPVALFFLLLLHANNVTSSLRSTAEGTNGRIFRNLNEFLDWSGGATGKNAALGPAKLRLERVPQTVHRRVSTKWRRGLAAEDEDSPVTYPLGTGPGTHYANVYIGTPPQRASVIVDTGSHILAFPCSGCDNCGQHTDPYFDMEASSTAKIVDYGSTCAYNDGGRCGMRQTLQALVLARVCWGLFELPSAPPLTYLIDEKSYTEGSSWKAVKVEDVLWVGGTTVDEALGQRYGTRFTFGCQTSETGLFESQFANGIMGMSDQEGTLVPHLHKEGKIERRLFALCFHLTGGLMTIGDVDEILHETKVQYAKMRSSEGRSGWFRVKMLDLQVGEGNSIGAPEKVWNTGKGVIVDSGTTDTYLSAAAAQPFYRKFKETTGIDFPRGLNTIPLTEKEASTLPDIRIILDGEEEGSTVVLSIPASQYLVKTSTTSYASTFFFDEQMGGVLGASTMVNHNVVFDSENQRVGFARSSCLAQETTSLPSVSYWSESTTTSGDSSTNYYEPPALFVAFVVAVSLAVIVVYGVSFCRNRRMIMTAMPGESLANEIRRSPSSRYRYSGVGFDDAGGQDGEVTVQIELNRQGSSSDDDEFGQRLSEGDEEVLERRPPTLEATAATLGRTANEMVEIQPIPRPPADQK